MSRKVIAYEDLVTATLVAYEALAGTVPAELVKLLVQVQGAAAAKGIPPGEPRRLVMRDVAHAWLAAQKAAEPQPESLSNTPGSATTFAPRPVRVAPRTPDTQLSNIVRLFPSKGPKGVA